MKKITIRISEWENILHNTEEIRDARGDYTYYNIDAWCDIIICTERHTITMQTVCNNMCTQNEFKHYTDAENISKLGTLLAWYEACGHDFRIDNGRDYNASILADFKSACKYINSQKKLVELQQVYRNLLKTPSLEFFGYK